MEFKILNQEKSFWADQYSILYLMKNPPIGRNVLIGIKLKDSGYKCIMCQKTFKEDEKSLFEDHLRINHNNEKVVAVTRHYYPEGGEEDEDENVIEYPIRLIEKIEVSVSYDRNEILDAKVDQYGVEAKSELFFNIIIKIIFQSGEETEIDLEDDLSTDLECKELNLISGEIYYDERFIIDKYIGTEISDRIKTAIKVEGEFVKLSDFNLNFTIEVNNIQEDIPIVIE